MEQKIKLSILAALVIAVVAGGVYFIETRKQALEPKLNAPGMEDPISGQEVSGEVLLVNEKAIYIELKDGKNFAANINSSTPVIIESVDEPGTLADLKAGQNVTVKADNADNAIQILIKSKSSKPSPEL